MMNIYAKFDENHFYFQTSVSAQSARLPNSEIFEAFHLILIFTGHYLSNMNGKVCKLMCWICCAHSTRPEHML